MARTSARARHWARSMKSVDAPTRVTRERAVATGTRCDVATGAPRRALHGGTP